MRSAVSHVGNLPIERPTRCFGCGGVNTNPRASSERYPATDNERSLRPRIPHQTKRQRGTPTKDRYTYEDKTHSHFSQSPLTDNANGKRSRTTVADNQASSIRANRIGSCYCS